MERAGGWWLCGFMVMRFCFWGGDYGMVWGWGLGAGAGADFLGEVGIRMRCCFIRYGFN